MPISHPIRIRRFFPLPVNPEDIEDVLANCGDAIDIDPEDLENLVNELIGRSQRHQNPISILKR